MPISGGKMNGSEGSTPNPGTQLAQLTESREDIPDPLLRAHMLPCRVVLETPVTHFTVGTLMELEPGMILETAAQHNEDLLLHVSGQLVGTVKFDVTRETLAVRVTGIA